VRRLWNKGPAIWFPWRLGTVIGSVDVRSYGLGAGHFAAPLDLPVRACCARRLRFVARACTRVRGDERLSGRQQGESDKIGKGKSSKARTGTSAPRDKGVRKQRASELGRALRSIYDDTLRESVPDDFMDLLGKLR
jgi:hypothetical protein